MIIAPLQLKINNFYNELNIFANNNRVMSFYNVIENFLENLEKYGIRLLN